MKSKYPHQPPEFPGSMSQWQQQPVQPKQQVRQLDPKDLPDALQVSWEIFYLHVQLKTYFESGHDEGWEGPFRPVLHKRQRPTSSIGYDELRDTRSRKRQSPFYLLIFVQVNNIVSTDHSTIFRVLAHFTFRWILQSTASWIVRCVEGVVHSI